MFCFLKIYVLIIKNVYLLIIWFSLKMKLFFPLTFKVTKGKTIFLYLPVGLLPCHSETPAWRRRPPWTRCSRRSPRPRAEAAAATGPPAAARRRSTDTCRSPTWMGPPTPLSSRTAAETEVRRWVCMMCAETTYTCILLACAPRREPSP